MFEGVEIGRKDDNGTPIKCGDRVVYTQYKEGFINTSIEDGWGQTRQLSRGDWTEVPPASGISRGVVFYNEKLSCFMVKWDGYKWSSGRTEDELYMLVKSVNRPNDSLIIEP